MSSSSRPSQPDTNDFSRSLFLFEFFREAMKAEHVLKSEGFDTRAEAPPPQVRTGCDIAISVPSDSVNAAEEVLRSSGIPTLGVVSVTPDSRR